VAGAGIGGLPHLLIPFPLLDRFQFDCPRCSGADMECCCCCDFPSRGGRGVVYSNFTSAMCWWHQCLPSMRGYSTAASFVPSVVRPFQSAELASCSSEITT
jgi:hypothetical protein